MSKLTILDAIRLLRRIDVVLDEAEFFHGPECRRVDGTPYYHCSDKCGLKQLESIQLGDIEPMLGEYRGTNE